MTCARDVTETEFRPATWNIGTILCASGIEDSVLRRFEDHKSVQMKAKKV
jgi:hypothetical protein